MSFPDARTAVVSLVALLFFGAFTVEAFERGEPNTDTRRAFCRTKYSACVKKSNDQCKAQFSDPAQYSACTTSAQKTCYDTYLSCQSAEFTQGRIDPKRLVPVSEELARPPD